MSSHLSGFFVSALFNLLLIEGNAAPEPSDSIVQELIDWIRSNGGYINDKLEVRHLDLSDASSPRGIFAVDSISTNETLCRIPWEVIIKPPEPLEGQEGIENTDCGTITSTIEAISGDNINPYGRYLLEQPRSYVPGFWSDKGVSLLEEMLGDQLTPHEVTEVWDDEWQGLCNGDITNPLHMHALMIVRARSDYKYLVPFYDMFNHHNGKYNMNHRHNYEEIHDVKTFELFATRNVVAGEELYNSYSQCNTCGDREDWFGTGDMFKEYGFVETFPQRWLFDFARFKFDLDWKDGDEASGEKVVTFLVPPSERGVHMLREELIRLDLFSKKHRGSSYVDAGIPKNEWNALWQYYDALHDALFYAINSQEELVDDVWKLDDDWWVQSGTITSDSDEHYVLPTPRDEL